MNGDESAFRRIGLFAKTADPQSGGVMAAVTKLLNDAGCEVMASANAAALMRDETLCTPDEIAAWADLAIVIGGDGSMLAAARALGWVAVPLIGVNRGRIGFLADIRSDALAAELGAVLRGDYIEERRSILTIETTGDRPETNHAINDVVIKRHDGSRVLEVEVSVGGDRFGRTRGDGLIVATSTGSTAYALSAGGPILAPDQHAFVIVPVCPHNLGERPAVVSADRAIHLRPLLGCDETADAVLDGQVSFTLSAGQALRVCRAEQELKLVHPPGYEYFATLREKLGWGGRAP